MKNVMKMIKNADAYWQRAPKLLTVSENVVQESSRIQVPLTRSTAFLKCDQFF